ncbi:MAG: deoxyadenosine/deoxycytidine kinase, partial [Roseivirga sp.]
MSKHAGLLEAKYIAIEGNIGSGKTTLAKLLAKKLQA